MKRDYSALQEWARQDLNDMHENGDFTRCNKCDRLHLKGYCCPYCGHDNSNPENIYNVNRLNRR